MRAFLVTGPAGFLGYHVVKLLNERGARPRVLLPRGADAAIPAVGSLLKLNVEAAEGSLDDPASLRAACDGIDTVLHVQFTIALGGGDQVARALYEGNVVGTANLLQAAADARVARVVVSSSVLAVGLSREPRALDETADWQRYAFRLPYALSRREAEQAALARQEPPSVVVVNPSFTLGPEDFVGAPANKLVMRMSRGGFRLSAPIGFGMVDVRDYADGVLRAAERGAHGRRYILSGANVMPDQLLREVCAVAGVPPPRWLFTLRAWMLSPVVAVLGLISRLKRSPPRVTRAVLELWGRYAWYDTGRAHAELGWNARPLRETLESTIRWARQADAARSRPRAS
jgi:dihydroflavonol-4-reductase